ncbi:MAG: prolyl oligopeptidase family serine peptidase [Acidobacteria bacterium]|nr:prolyl oligopeptidase family serine peptidase [Acidobacteriota bacterium]
MAKISAPYGSWRSPLTPAVVSADGLRFSEPSFDGDDLYWLERRPAEGGRSVVVRRTPEGRIEDCFGRPMDARTLVHEYGGGSYVVGEGVVYFVNFDDQQVYRVADRGRPIAVTAERELRFADLRFDPGRRRLLAVAEDHSGSGEPESSIVAIGLEDGRVETLVEGADFYSDPLPSPHGRRLAWLSWSHPDMPWDRTGLWVADLDPEGRPSDAVLVAGGDGRAESVFQPRWSPRGELWFVSDRSGWWKLYRRRSDGPHAMTAIEAEVGRQQWVFRMSTYAFEGPDVVVLAYSRSGTWQLAELGAGELRDLPSAYTDIQYLEANAQGRIAFVGAASALAPAIVLAGSRTEEVIVRTASAAQIDAGLLSQPRSIEFPTAAGGSGHAFYYPPCNPRYQGVAREKPMLLVLSHGGPTAAASSGLNLGLQYWTSRGFAVLDVDYRGSTGYGRAYREALEGLWGVADVADCVAAARALVDLGEVDAERLAIRGGSAGGFTTLAALTFTDVFRAGASYYGIGDLETLARDTHKFESRYLDRLVGPFPEAAEVYRRRSPIHASEKLSCPVIFFQGLEDKVVPPDQTETMVEALRRQGIPVAYVPFAGEQHGFRRAENIERALEAELYFYSRVFGFSASGELAPVEIHNADRLPPL